MHDVEMQKLSIALISTGGTIEKTYDALAGVLENSVSVLDVMIASLELRGVVLDRIALMNKDSLEMDAQDHAMIADAVTKAGETDDGVDVVHGTDRLAKSAEVVLERGVPRVPVVFTGAMRPFMMRNTDALQNLTEALTAVQLCGPGVYVVMHNRVLSFPGVVKDYDAMTFAPSDRRQRERRRGDRRRV